ncbi:hypothetical protein H0R92_11175 [Treponema sp. OMZ 840]|uniref:sugar-binding domain-containing protein n=1 Tax=Treponema sp. OMZ 840 TaxID=244313 RepID=UPI003D8D5A16
MISDDKLLEVAIDYYIRHKTQNTIAQAYGVSHVQIGNYLKEAQRRGIVTISVNLPVNKNETDSLNGLFKNIFGIKQLVLVQGSNNSDKSLKWVVKKAASHILETFPNNISHIGIGWGKTMYDLSLLKNEGGKKSNWIYYPVCLLPEKGENPYFDTVRLVENLAAHWGGKTDKAFIDKLLINQKLALHDNCDSHDTEEWHRLHVLICGLGCATSRFPSQRAEMFSDSVFKKINTKNLVGDILHNFYDIDGNLYGVSSGEILIPKETIEQIPWVIAVACGFPKVESIIGALRTGLVHTLVTDVQTAHNVIDYLK